MLRAVLRSAAVGGGCRSEATRARIYCSTFTAAHIRDSDEGSFRGFLKKPSFLPALATSEDLSAAFADRIAESPLAVAPFGEPEHRTSDGVTVTKYALCLGTEEPFIIGMVTTLLWTAEARGMLVQPKSCAKAVPVSSMAQLVWTSALEMRKLGAEDVDALASLSGLCAFVAEERAWKDLDEPARGAVEAIALGRPRQGHSVLGQGTFRDAEEAWSTIALDYAACSTHGEAAVFREAGAGLVGINWLHDTSPEAISDSSGSTASFRFPSEALPS